MSEYVENVKQVVADLQDWAQRNSEADRPDAATKMFDLVKKLEGVPKELIRLYGLTSALPADLGNIHDLPAELLEELSVAKTDELEDQLVTVIKAYGDEASLDQVLVGLYRKFKVTQKRRFIQNKLYRMDTVWSVGGKKGVYTTIEPTVEDETPSSYSGFGGGSDLDSEIPF